MNIYLKVFFDTFLSYLSFGLYKENLYFIALQFKNNIFIFSIFSLLGFLFAITINYYIGFFLKKISLKKQEENSFIHFLKKFSFFIIFFSSLNHFANQIFLIIYGSFYKKFYSFIFAVFLGRIFFILTKLFF
jgi:membrane protein YqaA with SNARE-associated domain